MSEISEIDYPDISKIPAGNQVFLAYADLPFAERMLAIVQPVYGRFTLYLIRDNEGKLHIVDDLKGMDKLKKSDALQGLGPGQNPDSQHSACDLMPAIESCKAVDVPEFMAHMNDHYYVAKKIPGVLFENEYMELPKMHLAALAQNWVDAQWRMKGATQNGERDLQQRVARLFSKHLGLDYSDIMNAGTELNPRTGFLNDKIISTIALRPLRDIPIAANQYGRYRFEFGFGENGA